MWFALLTVAYLITRLWSLSSFPSFIDEAVHIESARETLHGRLLAGSWEGRWLSIKLMAACVALPLPTLVAARLSAVLAGVGVLTSVVWIGQRLYSPAVGLVAGLLYVVLPFALLYNRMALAETLAVACAGAVLSLSIDAVHSHRTRNVTALSIALVCMLLAKFHTVVLLPIPLIAIVSLTPRAMWRRHLVRLSPAFIPVVVMLASMVWRGHGVHYLGEQAASGWPGAAIMWRNLGRVSSWLWILVTPPIVTASLLLLLWRSRRGLALEPADLFLTATFLLAVLPFVVAAHTWFPRYLTPTLLPLCVGIARAACTIASTATHRPGLAAVAVLLVGWPLRFDYLIIVRPQQAPLPRIERGEFFEGAGAGTGVPELADFLRARSLASANGINVVRFYFWNQANQGLGVYLSPTPALGFHTIDPNDHDAAVSIDQLAARRPSFFVLNPPSEEQHLTTIGKSLNDYFHGAEKVWSYVRPGGKSALEVWALP